MAAALGVLGGTFDPVHCGHLLIAEAARDALRLSRVLFAPAAQQPLKPDAPVTPVHHRVAMVGLAIESNPCFEISLVDVNRPGPHYTLDAVRLIREEYGLSGEECFFILGADSLNDLPRWSRPGELLWECRLAVASRPGSEIRWAELEREFPSIRGRVDVVPVPGCGISARDLRRRFREGRTVRYQVPPRVEEYARRHALYV